MIEYYIGIMSGTSLDAVDVVIADLSSGCKIIAQSDTAFPKELHQRLTTIIQTGKTTFSEMGQLDVELAQLYATAVNNLVSECNISKNNIIAIGCHGQTVYHQPSGDIQFSIQLGSASTLVENTGITVVNDFRNRDMAAGGQGAPLVPAFHQAVYSDENKSRLIINIGGLSNCSWLPTSSKIKGYDIGPGNTLLDSWIQHTKNKPFDKDGEWASSGKVIQPLLEELLTDKYFNLTGPKSTGREYFNLKWLNTIIQRPVFSKISDVDIQTTLTELTAKSITDTINHMGPDEAYLCGGGVLNHYLVNRIKTLSQYTIRDINGLGIAPDYVEAAAFAWLAKQCVDGNIGTLASVTGAQSNNIAGAIYQV